MTNKIPADFRQCQFFKLIHQRKLKFERTTPTMSDSEAKPSADTITVRVKDQAGDETFFKIKNTTKMAKVFKAYATRKGVQGKINPS